MTSGNADAAFGQRLSLKVRLPGLPHAPGGARGTRPRHPQREDPPSKGRCRPGPFKAHTNRGPVGLLLHVCAWGATAVAECRWLPGSSSQEEKPTEPGPGQGLFAVQWGVPTHEAFHAPGPLHKRRVTVSFGHVLLPCDCFYAHWPPPKKLTILRFRSLRH